VGEKQNQPFQLSFNASLKVDFQGSRVTSDGGLILVRELDQRLGAAANLGSAGAERVALRLRLQNLGPRRRVGAVSEKSIARQQPGRVRRAKNEPSAPSSLDGGLLW